jgi:dipeptidyl aminopeptidase/acylaminoacyl peptidase
MRTLALATLFPLLFSAPPARAEDPPAAWTPELALRVRRVTDARVSPDGSRVAFVVAEAQTDGKKSEWLSHVHVGRADGSGAFALTGGEKSCTAPAWSPDGKWLAFLSARGPGDKPPNQAAGGDRPKANVWRIRVDGGEAEQLTDEKGGVSALRWSPDGKSIAFVMPDPPTPDQEKADEEKRDVKVVDEDWKMLRLYVIPVEKDAAGKRVARKLTTGALSVGNVGSAAGFDWSPDGASIAFAHTPSPLINDWPRGDVSVVEVASGTVRPLAATNAAESDPTFSPDGRSVAYAVTNDPPSWRQKVRVAVVPAAGGSPRLLGETHDGQPDIVGWLKDGRLVVAETWRTVARLAVLPADGGPPAFVTPEDVMVTGPAINRAGTHVSFVSQAPDRPVEAFVSALPKFAAVQASRAQEALAAPLGRTETLSWKSPDGNDVEGLVTYPVGYAEGSRVPLLVVVHGGPAGVFTRTFTGAASPYPVAAFAARGYAVLRVNPRGSSGYGYEFRNANYRDWGGGDYRDIMSGVDALIAKGLADPERMGIMGWSYGGYMTSWVVTQTTRFKAASVGAGVTNLVSFTGTADIPGFIPDYFGGEFWEDGGVDRWRAHSAMFQVQNVKTPTLIQHGEADLRVPVSQGYELYNALRRRGVPAKMIVYPRQPHGLQEPKFIDDAMRRNLEWFDRWVLGQGAAPAK